MEIVGCGSLGENGRCDAGDAWDCDFAGQGRISQDLGGGIEVSEGVGGDYHDCLLRVSGRG